MSGKGRVVPHGKTQRASWVPSKKPRSLFGADVTYGTSAFAVEAPIVHRQSPSRTLTADSRRAHLVVSGVAKFSVSDGEHVNVDAEPGVTDEELGVWLFGTVSALLLGQQGRFALHASTVALSGGTAVAVGGAIGSGKSTTSLALMGRGNRLVADDVTPISVVGRSAEVEPFGRPVHVWPATYTALGIAPPIDAWPMPSTEKLGLPSPSGGITDLGAVVVLRPAPGVAEVSIARLEPSDAVPVLMRIAYRLAVVKELWPSNLLRWTGVMSSVVPTFVLTRPLEGWTAPAVADAIEQMACQELATRP